MAVVSPPESPHAESASSRRRKQALRERLRTQRRGFPAERIHAGRLNLARVAATAPPLVGARTLVGYLACDGEPDVSGILEEARLRGVAVLLPRQRPVDGGLDLVALADPGEPALRPGRGGVRVPEGPAALPGTLSAPVMVLAPAVALDRRGTRLGRGGGAYDRLFAAQRGAGWTFVGVCHPEHVLGDLPLEAHDQPVDAILTEDGFQPVHRAGAAPDGGNGPAC